MIKTKREFYDKLNCSEKKVWQIVTNVECFYEHRLQAKTKFGKPQIDDNGQIKYRHLFIPNTFLRRLQSTILTLVNGYSFPDYMYGSIQGRNHIQNAFHHRQSKYFFNVDLEAFFSNISHKQVYQAFISLNFAPDVARIATKLTTINGSLPQGAPTSPFLSNIVLLPAAKKLSHFAEKHDLNFSCYLDDLTFSSKKNFKNITKFILQIIRDNGFRLAYNKINFR
jgi:RNA-directed DNA polymerase